MDPNTDQIAIQFPTLLQIYKDGHVERLQGTEFLSPSIEPKTGVQSKDTTISPESGLSARLFITLPIDPTRKLPLLIYIHGGGFCVQSPFSPLYHNHVAALTSKANVISLSVNYRRPPEHPLPIAYEDAWDVVQWASAHSNRNGPEAWVNDHVDFERVFVAGDSAGGNIVHNVVLRVGVDGLSGLKIIGMILFHPFFSRNEAAQAAQLAQFFEIIFPSCTGLDDPRLNPSLDPNLAKLGCDKALVFIAEKDLMRDRGLAYYEALKKSDWVGEVELVETKGEDHIFHLLNPTCDNAVALINKVVSFLKHE